MNDATVARPQALIVMDCQCAIIDTYVTNGEAFLDRAELALDVARRAGVEVIYVVVGFRPGHPEIAPQNRMFGPISERGTFLRGAPAFAVSPRIAPREGEIVIEKHRVCSFEGTDLDMILRAKGIRRLALCGVMTGGCVLSTVRRGADLDYELTVLSDLCVDTDPDIQRVLMEKVFPSQARVVTAQEWSISLSG